MADGRVNNGGARAGAGRKRKAAEEELQRLLKKCWPKKDREAAIRVQAQRAAAGSLEALKFLTQYGYGKPTELSKEQEDTPVEHVVMTLDEWKQRAAARNQEADNAMKPFAEDGDAA